MKTQLNIMKAIQACAEMLDQVGVDNRQHGKRVAFLAFECCKEMNCSQEVLNRLFRAALLHDCGVSSTELHRKLVTELDWPGSEEHCVKGAELLELTPVFQDLAVIVRRHHAKWQDLVNVDLSEDERMICNAVYLADRVDALIAQHDGSNILYLKDIIRERVMQYRDTFFSGELLDVFWNVSANEAYWLMLNPIYIDRYIAEYCESGVQVNLDIQTMHQIAGFVAQIVDAKSPYTANHSYAVSALARFLADKLGCTRETCDQIELAGLLHDLGKLNVPDEILEKAEPLSMSERYLIMHHSFDSYQILRRLEGFETIAVWAAFHHETLDGKGYPFRMFGDAIPLEARIISAADVFQAFAQKRPYRSALEAGQIMERIQDVVDHGKLDPLVVGCIGENLDLCFRIATAI